MKLSNWIYRISRGWLAVVSLVIFLLFSTLVLPSQAAKASTISEQVGSPDMSFFYTPNALYEMAEAYGEQGRTEYIRALQHL